MQKDYIMRMIEQFIQALASIILSRKGGNYEQALEQIQYASLKFLNSDITSFLAFTPEELVRHFDGDNEKSIFCAGLLYELALLCKEEKAEADQLKMMALNLYLAAIPRDTQFQTPLYRDKVAALLKELPPLPKSIQHNYQKYLESC